VWTTADPHREAFNALTSNWGQEAAKRVNASDARAEGSICFKCHTTVAGSANPLDSSEGVSCEACHGPASDWMGHWGHGDIDDKAEKMQDAIALGLIDLRMMDIREQNCRTCHIDNRPCYRPTDPTFSANDDRKFKHWRDIIPPL
jgi:hypothetical protein